MSFCRAAANFRSFLPVNLAVLAITVPIALMGSLGLSGPAEAAPPLMGQGAHVYRWQPDWLKLPPGMTLGQTHGDVVVDARGRIFFSTDTKNALFMTEPTGRIVKVLGHEFGGGIHGMRLATEGGQQVLWLAHLNKHAVIKISLDGKELMRIPVPEGGIYTKPEEYLPTALDVAPNGDVYVVDGYGKGWIHRFDAQGKLLQSWNGQEGAGAFKEPHGVGIDLRGAEPRVVVADRRNHRLQIFTLDGRYIREVTSDLRLPSKIVTQGKDMVVVDLEGRLTLFDADYAVVAQLGDNEQPELRGTFNVPPSQWKAGQFISPHGAAWDKQGNLYVQDWNAFGRMNKLVRVRGGKIPK